MSTIEELEARLSGQYRNTIHHLAEHYTGQDREQEQHPEGMGWFKMQAKEPQKTVCPLCKIPKIHKRKHAPGYYCYSCKVAFSAPLNKEAI